MSKIDYSQYDSYYKKLFLEGKTQWGGQEGQDELHKLAMRGILPHQRVLLLGCGTGALAERLQPLKLDCVGVDISPAAIERAKLRLQGVSDYHFEVASVCDLPESLGQFDTIVDENCTWCIVLEDRTLLWQSIRNRLKPNGTALLKSMIGTPPRAISLAREPDLTYDANNNTVYRNQQPIRHSGTMQSFTKELQNNSFKIVFAELHEHPESEDHAWVQVKMP